MDYPMESPSSFQPPQNQAQQQQQQQPFNSSRNLKNWFDEFKAKVSKKNQPIQTASGGGGGSGDPITVDEPLSPRSIKEIPISSVTSSRTKVKGPNSTKIRKVTKISTTDSPDFDTASVRTIFNRKDSRYETLAPRRQNNLLMSKFLSILQCALAYLIPFDYNLPWKLLCVINSSFVIIVIGLISSQSSTAFNFINGFIGGLLSAFVCFVILVLSFTAKVLPKSRPLSSLERDQSVQLESRLNSTFSKSTVSRSSCYTDSKKGASIDMSQPKLEDFSLFEILDGNGVPNSPEKVTAQSSPSVVCAESVDVQDDTMPHNDDDADYRGWMIEFIGDYEQRNTADIKLKSIYVRIEDGILYLCKPKSSHDAEMSALPMFSNQRVYDLNSVKKFSISLLIPKTVRNKQKYVWSKKYPIRLDFQEDVCASDSSTVTTTSKSNIGQVKTIQLTLFSKSCREKEEWFRRFKRIVEEKRLSQCQKTSRKCSIKSEESTCNESINESFFSSLKRFRRRSPSPESRDSVQTNQTYHSLNDSKQFTSTEEVTTGKQIPPAMSSVPLANLTRTKSCELLPNDNKFSGTHDRSDENFAERASDDGNHSPQLGTFPADDSTLTKETAELFGQAMEFSNFIEGQPTLNYQDYIERVIELGQEASSTSDWFNALTGRIFFDVFSQNYWSVWFKRKIQRKLYRIRLPYFMETLTLTKIDLGTNAPQFLNVVSHNFDSYGLSIDFDMSYSGGLSMTFETKLNLLKIKSDNASINNSGNSTAPCTSGAGASGNNAPTASSSSNVSGTNPSSSSSFNQQQSPQVDLSGSGVKDGSIASDISLENVSREQNNPSLSSTSTRTSGESSDSSESDSDSSSGSSFDEAEANEISDWEDYGAEKTRQNIVKFVDKIASSRYFQHATENRFIKRKLQDISNCPLVLVVQIQSLNGVLTLNVPPPQTDRIWYGFKPSPELTLKATPKMGDREVNLAHVTDWIERKLAEEFKKILVIPNMEDIVLPVLKSDHLQYVTATR